MYALNFIYQENEGLITEYDDIIKVLLTFIINGVSNIPISPNSNM